jgi:hypothetical protein
MKTPTRDDGRRASKAAAHGDERAGPHDQIAESPRSIAQRRQLDALFGAHAPGAPVQRKVAYKGSAVANPGDFTAEGTWGRLADELVGVVDTYYRTLDQKARTDNKELAQAAELVLSKGRSPEMIDAIYRLRASDRDYGTFDLADDQHKMLLIFELARSLGFDALQAGVSEGSKPEEAEEYQARVRKENEEEILGHEKAHAKRETERKAHFEKSPNPGLTFTLAVLGNGASAAYYLEANRGSIDPIQSVVIGEANPWAGQRGTEGAEDEDMHINHPMHMISPDRSEPGTADESLASRREFAEVVEQEIRKIVRFVWDTRIRSVRKIDSKGAAFYEIDTEKYGKCYAQNVVAALGTGPHIEVANKKALNEAFALQDGQDPVPRVMNLDEFQHQAARLRSKSKGRELDIFVSGGNAAIDAVTRIVRENEKSKAQFKLIWVKGTRGAQFLDGTDNEETKAKHEGHLKSGDMAIIGRTGDLSQREAKVSVTVNRVDMEATKAARRIDPTDTRPRFKDPEQIEADYYVHGTGQDVGPILDLFIDDEDKGNPVAREAFAKGLSRTVDPNFNFGPQPGPKPKGESPEAYALRQEEFRQNHQALSGYETRTAGAKGEAYDTGTSLRFIGATASKIAGIRGETKRHDANIQSLPQDVVGNEQLAPIRAAEESQSGMVPGYVGRDANFAVDNKTVVRLHIALKYPKIPPDRADMWAEIIVGQRRPSDDLKARHPELVGPIPNPVPAPHRTPRETAETYTRAFEGILARENSRG